MSREHLEQFQELVLADAALQQRLVSVADRHAFLSLVIALAAAHGYHVTVAELEQAMQDGRRARFEQKAVR